MPDLVAIGHVLMDIRIFVDEFPVADGEAKTDKLSLGGGGSAANVAVGASRLGVKSGFIGSIGFDTFGRVLLEELEHDGVDVTHVKVDTATSSGLTVIAINMKGQVMMFGYAGASDKLFPSDLDKDYISTSEHVHITGLSFDTALAAAKIAKKANVTVSFDPGRLMSRIGLKSLLPLLRYVDQILLNQEEAQELTGLIELEKVAKTLLSSGPKIVIVKRGPNGVFAMDHSKSFSVPAYPVKVVDTTGAGDAFSAGFITAQLEGKSLEDSVEFANATANLKITRVGARALPNRKAVERFLKEYKESKL
ncbi:MAG: carbohydrate kinase family protein [Candidatus Bathyarchaeia archaeon]